MTNETREYIDHVLELDRLHSEMDEIYAKYYAEELSAEEFDVLDAEIQKKIKSHIGLDK